MKGKTFFSVVIVLLFSPSIIFAPARPRRQKATPVNVREIDQQTFKLTKMFLDLHSPKISWKCYCHAMRHLLNDHTHPRTKELIQWFRDVGSSESLIYITAKFVALAASGTEGMPRQTQQLFDALSLADLKKIVEKRIELNKQFGNCNPKKQLEAWGIVKKERREL